MPFCPVSVLSCLVLSCLVLSCLVLSCLVLSCPFLSCPFFSSLSSFQSGLLFNHALSFLLSFVSSLSVDYRLITGSSDGKIRVWDGSAYKVHGHHNWNKSMSIFLLLISLTKISCFLWSLALFSSQPNLTCSSTSLPFHSHPTPRHYLSSSLSLSLFISKTNVPSYN